MCILCKVKKQTKGIKTTGLIVGAFIGKRDPRGIDVIPQRGPRTRFSTIDVFNLHVNHALRDRPVRYLFLPPVPVSFFWTLTKFPGPVVNRGPVSLQFSCDTRFSPSLFLSPFRGYATARAVVCVVVRPGDYAVARGPFPPPPLRPPSYPPRSSHPRAPRVCAHTYTYMCDEEPTGPPYVLKP